MRLKFNMLWVDDQPNEVDSHMFNIEPAMTEEGFGATCTVVRSLDEAMKYLSEEGVIVDNIDLVLIDYHLHSDADGDVVAKEVRKRVPYKDIVFYSSDNNAMLQQKISDQRVEGVFCAHRSELDSKVRGLFRYIVRKVVDLEHMRGIVMGATSDFEQIVTEAIVAFDSQLSEVHRDELIEFIDTKLAGSLSDLDKIRGKVLGERSLTYLMKKHQFTAVHRLGLLVQILILHSGGSEAELCGALDLYAKEIMPKRNKLGHVRVRVTGSMTELKGNETEYTVAELRQLRTDLVDSIGRFEAVEKIAKLSEGV